MRSLISETMESIEECLVSPLLQTELTDVEAVLAVMVHKIERRAHAGTSSANSGIRRALEDVFETVRTGA